MSVPILFDMVHGVIRTAALGSAARLGIADLLAAGPLDAAEISSRTGTSRDAMHRMLRTLVSAGVFELDAEGRFANNRVSDLLRTDAPTSMRDIVASFGSPSSIRAYADLDGTLESGKNAFERVHGKDIWSWFQDHPEEGKTFAGSMQSVTAMVAPLIARDRAWGGYTRVCDVSGGHGTLLAEILARHPALRGILFDQADVLAGADALLERRGVLDRVEKVAGSLFESVPSGADAYVLKDVLHDWDDARSRSILTNVRRACDAGAAIVLVEAVLEPNEVSAQKCKQDFNMMMVSGEGRQRSRGELQRLLDECGFRLVEVKPLPVVMYSLVIGAAR